jgi:hypothetical protein
MMSKFLFASAHAAFRDFDARRRSGKPRGKPDRHRSRLQARNDTAKGKNALIEGGDDDG